MPECVGFFGLRDSCGGEEGVGPGNCSITVSERPVTLRTLIWDRC
jgi:hypothetical protein